MWGQGKDTINPKPYKPYSRFRVYKFRFGVSVSRVSLTNCQGFLTIMILPEPTKTYFFVGPPINSMLGFIIRTYKKVGFGSLR